MSFGVAVGDFIAVGNLAWRLYRACKGMTSEFEEVGREALATHTVVKELEDEAKDEQSVLNRRGASRQPELMAMIGALKAVLLDFDKIIIKYQRLTRRERRVWDQLKLAAEDLSGIRDKLTFHLAAINAVTGSLSRGTLSRMENVLLELVQEIREGRRPATLVSIDEPQDRSGWKELEIELALDGINENDVAEHKAAIRAFLLARLKDSTTDDISFYDVASAIESARSLSHESCEESDEAPMSSGQSVMSKDLDHVEPFHDDGSSDKQSFQTAHEQLMLETKAASANTNARISFAPFPRIEKQNEVESVDLAGATGRLRRFSIGKPGDWNSLRYRRSVEQGLGDTLGIKPQKVLVIDPIHSSLSKLMHAYLRSLTKQSLLVGQCIETVRSTGWQMHESGGIDLLPIDSMIKEVLKRNKIESPGSDTFDIADFRLADILQFDHIIYLNSPSFLHYLEDNTTKIAKIKAQEVLEHRDFARLTAYTLPNSIHIPEYMTEGRLAGAFRNRQRLAIDEILRTVQRFTLDFLERGFGLKRVGKEFKRTVSKRPSKASLISNDDRSTISPSSEADFEG